MIEKQWENVAIIGFKPGLIAGPIQDPDFDRIIEFWSDHQVA